MSAPGNSHVQFAFRENVANAISCFDDKDSHGRFALRAGNMALFIDGSNLHHTAKAVGFEIDFTRLLEEFQRRGDIQRAFFYTTVKESSDYVAVRPLIDWLAYHGFTVRAKPTREIDDGDGRRKFKRAIGVDLAVDAMETAPHVDRIVLFSGDGDFRPLVEAVGRRGVHVTVASSLRTKPPMIADELRREADEFIELDELRSVIGRPPTQIAARRST
jgi:uncharacterized LabA/DUF88 family protein